MRVLIEAALLIQRSDSLPNRPSFVSFLPCARRTLPRLLSQKLSSERHSRLLRCWLHDGKQGSRSSREDVLGARRALVAGTSSSVNIQLPNLSTKSALGDVSMYSGDRPSHFPTKIKSFARPRRCVVSSFSFSVPVYLAALFLSLHRRLLSVVFSLCSSVSPGRARSCLVGKDCRDSKDRVASITFLHFLPLFPPLFAALFLSHHSLRLIFFILDWV